MSKIIASAALATIMLAQPAFAAMDCGAMLDKYTSGVTKMGQMSAEKKAAMHRMVLQGYDHCVAGDEFNAKAYFDMLDKSMVGQK